jgi:hypothetical protein
MNRKRVRPMLKEGSDPEDWDESDIKGYHMTNHRSGSTRPIGYCVDHGPHDTKEEAMECWVEYQLEENYSDDRWGYMEKQRDECVVCGEWGRWVYQPAAYSWLPRVWACEEHKGKEAVEQEFNPGPGSASYGSF